MKFPNRLRYLHPCFFPALLADRRVF